MHNWQRGHCAASNEKGGFTPDFPIALDSSMGALAVKLTPKYLSFFSQKGIFHLHQLVI